MNLDRRNTITLLGGAILLVLIVAACSSEKQVKKDSSDKSPAVAETSLEPGADSQQQAIKKNIEYKMSEIPFDLNGKPVNIAGATYMPASQWNDLGAHGTSLARYTFGPLEGDKKPATMAIYYSGKDVRGNWKKDFERWIRWISFPDGRDPKSAALTHDREVDGMTAHVLSIFGNCNVPAERSVSGQVVQGNKYRLVGIVLEAPEGDVVFELNGPDYTARIMIEAFMTGIYKLRKSQ
ncbi:MAG: hypothetical protein U9R56_00430 [candidate division Zixibacteria bacterium]|nr:hypothetical protein [candidate division Zixibacteria bacterium]